MVSIQRGVRTETRSISWPRGHAAALVGLCLPALALSVAAAGSGVLEGDVRVTLLLQDYLPGQLATLFEAINWLGTSFAALGLTLLIGALLLAFRHPVAAGLVLLTFPLRLINGLLKIIIESPRPTDALVSISENSPGFGFPSGHTMGATLLYGMLYILAPHITTRRPLRLALQTGAVTMIVLTGISRIYVGAHWPSDVIGGYLWALAMLVTVVLVTRTWAARRRAI